jgi:hypothetical protein
MTPNMNSRVPFFEKLDRDVILHLVEAKAYKSGMVGLCYEVRGLHTPQNAAQPPNDAST